MRKFHLLGLALLAVFAFSAAVTSAASAAVTFLLAEWLYNGVTVTGELLVESAGELELTDTKGFLGAAATILCSGILDGFIEPASLDLITELLNLSKEAISLTALVGLSLTCTNVTNCATPVVWAVHLPWLTEVELMEDPTGSGTNFFVVLILNSGAGAPGWYVQCKGVLGEPEDECTATEGVFELMNESPTPNALFSEAFAELAEVKLAGCTRGGAETGKVEGSGLIEHPEGGTVSASSGA